MQRMPCLIACLLLAHISISLAADVVPQQSFADWLASKQATNVAKLQSDSYYYEPRKVEHVCLKENTYKNCRESPQDVLYYWESGVTCCDGGSSIGTAVVETGTCKFSEWYFTDEIVEGSGVYKWGEFSVQCYMNAAADTCGHPFCDQMVLSASGGIYYATDVVFPSTPSSPVPDPTCLVGSSRSAKLAELKKKSAQRIGGKVAEQPSDGKASLAGAEWQQDPSTLQTGKALIYFGPMTVNSRLHDVKASEGWFEYAYVDEVTGTIPADDIAGRHMVAANSYALKFYKPQAY